MAESKQRKAVDPDKSKTIFDLFWGAVFLILFSLFISIIVEWIGMTWFWEDEGSKHSLKMLSTEINYINKDFSHQNIAGYRPIDFVSHSYEAFYGNAEKSGVAQDFINWLHSPTDSNTSAIEGYIKSSSNSIKEYLLAALYIILVFAIRLSILTLSLPLFFLVAILAAIDGLAIRDVRRWSNGRESGFRYHYAKSFVLPSFCVAWMFYLSVPFSIHPNIVILPLCLLMGIIVRSALTWFKKYL
jgi:integrating conjugative element membrane protein (TIGR03747 family)